MSTVQFDFNLPERFQLTYTGEDGQAQVPYMIHRALLGSLERFFGIMIEHYAGAFPLWLAPEQVRVLPLTEKQRDYALAVGEQLRQVGVRYSVDERSEKVGAKIRHAQLAKIPYMLIVGPKEAADGTVAVRARPLGDVGSRKMDAFLATLLQEQTSRALATTMEPSPKG